MGVAFLATFWDNCIWVEQSVVSCADQSKMNIPIANLWEVKQNKIQRINSTFLVWENFDRTEGMNLTHLCMKNT